VRSASESISQIRQAASDFYYPASQYLAYDSKNALEAFWGSVSGYGNQVSSFSLYPFSFFPID